MPKFMKATAIGLFLTVCLFGVLIDSEGADQIVVLPQAEPVGPPRFVVKVDGKDGFINEKGKLVIPATFDKAYPFSDGLAAVQVGKLWGFIDTEGRTVIEPRFVMVSFFSDGLAAVREKKFTDPWGYIDKQGKMVIKPQFDAAEEFYKGIARVGFETLESKILGRIADVGTKCDYQFIDRTGAFVPQPAASHYAAGTPGELIPFRKGNLFGFLDSEGQVVIDARFQAVSRFSEGLACVCEKELFGYIDQTGKFVIPPRFQYAANFSEGLAGVPLGKDGWGFINAKGETVIKPGFNWIYGGFRHGLAEVTTDGKIGYVDKTGEWVWKPSE